MKTVFDACVPRDEVLEAGITADIFAASLTDVINEKAEAVYQDPATFFENTYATSGLKELLSESLGRLTGKKPSSSPIIRLETSFGGGKTHNLIGLYHIARGSVDSSYLEGFIDVTLIPKKPIKNIAGIVGTDLEVAEGLDHGDAVVHTIWGEIAYQFGGSKSYELLRKADESKIAPGTPTWEKLIGDEPALIMIDEIARYLRTAKGDAYKVGGSNLAEQTAAFLMSLLKFASEKKQVVVVYTLAESADAFGTETDEIRKELSEAKSISSRMEHIVTPSVETELSAIVSHRLFKSINRETAKETAKEYAKFYRIQQDHDIDLPARSARSEYADEIANDYPFHPELLTTFNRKTSTIPNFQRTRGALRLLAMCIRELWQKKPSDTYLIQLHDIDLSSSDIANDMTSRLERPAYKQVIEADIVTPREGSRAHAQEIDVDWLAAGKPPYAQRIATAVFIHSLTQTGQSGVTPADLRLAVIRPGDDPSLLDKATERLLDSGWHFDYDGLRYRFRPEPSLNKLVDDEMNMVGRVAAKTDVDDRIKQVWKKSALKPVYFASEAADVDDDADTPKLVVIHYDAAHCDPGDKEPPERVQTIFEHAGSLEGYRTYKNNLVFLVADSSLTDRMIDQVQRHLAIQRIVGDSDRLKDFTPDQQKKLKGMEEAARLEVRIAITKAYRFLFYPSADAPKRSANLACETLPAQDQGEVDKDQTQVVLRVLKNMGKVITADDKPMPAEFVKSKAWPQNADSISTEDLRKAFAQRLGLKMLLDINQLKTTIKTGASREIWVYYNPEERVGYGKPSPAPLVSISNDTILYTPEEAKRVKIKIKGEDDDEIEETCPVCGNDPCTCAETGPEHIETIQADGTPAQAFQRVLDQCVEQNRKRLKTLYIKIEGHGAQSAGDSKALGLAVPQIGKGIYRVEQQMVAEFGKNESFNVDFRGSWDRYKRLKSVTDSFGDEATEVKLDMTLKADFEAGLDVESAQFQTIRDVLDSLGVGRVYVTAEPEEKAVGDSEDKEGIE